MQKFRVSGFMVRVIFYSVMDIKMLMFAWQLLWTIYQSFKQINMFIWHIWVYENLNT